MTELSYETWEKTFIIAVRAKMQVAIQNGLAQIDFFVNRLLRPPPSTRPSPARVSTRLSKPVDNHSEFEELEKLIAKLKQNVLAPAAIDLSGLWQAPISATVPLDNSDLSFNFFVDEDEDEEPFEEEENSGFLGVPSLSDEKDFDPDKPIGEDENIRILQQMGVMGVGKGKGVPP